MISVMSSVLQSERLKRLELAQSISLSVDDRGSFRIVRYRCGYLSPSDFEQACAGNLFSDQVGCGSGSTDLETLCSYTPLMLEGVLGVIFTGGNVDANTIEAHDEDKSEKMKQSIMQCLKQACADSEGRTDMSKFQHICSRVRHFASDQGASAHKCGLLLSHQPELMNFLWVSCDMAHQVRIAAKDPLHANEQFKEQWDRLFNSKHALIPDIQNSDVWKSRLIAAQKTVLQTVPTVSSADSADARMGSLCELDRVMHTFSFAKQRFNSISTPMMKYCCMIRAIALVCAMQAGDVPVII